MNKQLINIGQIIIGILLVFLIMIQAKGGGLGFSLGGTAGFYRSKRGLEKGIFVLTILIALVFFILSAVNFFFFS